MAHGNAKDLGVSEKDLEAIYRPAWGERSNISLKDWRNQVPKNVKLCWEFLSPDVKLLAYSLAKDAADRAEGW